MANLKYVAGKWRLILETNHACVFSSSNMDACVEHAKLEGIEIIPTGWVK